MKATTQGSPNQRNGQNSHPIADEVLISRLQSKIKVTPFGKQSLFYDKAD
jgi:hypothetical protein